MRLALAGLIIVGAVLARGCSTPKAAKEAFGSYLSCIKSRLDTDYGRFEEELHSHSRRAAHTCFAQSISGANARGRCVLMLEELNEGALARNGPLKECPICPSPSRTSLSSTRVSPSVEATSQQEQRQRDVALPTLSLGTSKSIARSCDTRIAVGACAKVIPQTSVAACQCIHEVADDLKRHVSSISSVISQLVNSGQGMGNKVDVCMKRVKEQLVTPANDWSAVLKSAISTCIRNNYHSYLSKDALLNIICKRAIADTTGKVAKELKAGLNFVNNLIDAMADRSGRFCGAEHRFAIYEGPCHLLSPLLSFRRL